jgi:drug/metabolite transporter (DMT)-like permease
MTTRTTFIRLGALIAITAVWGWTFVMVKEAVSVFPVTGFLAYRFVLATVILLPWMRRMDWKGIRSGVPIGLVMGGAFILQTIGLRLTLASDTGLITGLFVIFVPLIEWLALRVRIRAVTFAGLGLAVIGLILLVGGLPRQLALGDLLVAVSAIGFAIQIILLSRRSPSHDTLSLTVGQTAGAAAIFVVAALMPIGGGLALPPSSVWPAILITATLATALGFFVQAWAQRDLAATPAAVVLLTEPAWATFFGVVLSGNPFPLLRIMGAALLFLTPLLITFARPGRRILIYVAKRQRARAA